MPAIKGVTCSLTIEDQDHPAQECGVITKDDFTSAYVVAEADKRFYVSVSTTEFVHENLEVYVYIDGKYQNSSIWTELRPGKNLDERYQGKRERDDDDERVAFERAWRFDDLVVVDERGDECEREHDVLSNIGIVEVVILRCNKVPKRARGRPRRGEEVAGSASRNLNDDTVAPHPDSKPYWKNWAIEEERVADPADAKAIFEKDIKSLDITPRMLQNMGYIPKSATSSRESSADLEVLWALPKEEMLKELLRYKKLAESIKRVKSESAGASERELKRVKPEGESPRWISGELVDLTDD